MVNFDHLVSARLAAGEGQPNCSQPVALSLSDVLHEVPLLLELIPSDSLAALLAVNQTHRRQIHEHVRHIVLPDQEHIQTLVNGSWPSLVSWHLGDSMLLQPHTSFCSSPTRYSSHNASDAAVSLLIKGYAPEMQDVTLSDGSITAAGIAQLHRAGWNRLQSCCLRRVELTSAAIQALCRCADTWLLEQLDLSHNPLDAVAMSHLRAASWPRLQDLDLSNTGLSQEAFQQLCLSTRVSNNSSSSSGSSSGSSRGRCIGRCSSMCCTRCWPAWSQQHTGLGGTCLTGEPWHRWTCHLKRLDLSHNSLTASSIEQLTKMPWPCLEKLFIQHTSIDVDAMTHLACMRWNRLLLVDISGLAVAAPALQVLLKARLKAELCYSFTVNLRDKAVFKQLLAYGWGRLGLRRLQLQAVFSFFWQSKICLHKVKIQEIWPSLGKGMPLSKVNSYMRIDMSITLQ